LVVVFLFLVQKSTSLEHPLLEEEEEVTSGMTGRASLTKLQHIQRCTSREWLQIKP
jgi:hypothetical protein